MISLENLLGKFKPVKNFVIDGAHRMTHIPWRGTHAYLNTLFDAANSEVQQETIDPLGLPPDVREFYRTYNGADLFFNCLSVYGFFPRVYYYDRGNKFYPYNIKETNVQHSNNMATSEIVLVGCYGVDLSEVIVEKTSGLVHCSVGDDLTKLRATWPSFEAWIEEEIPRLCHCFDEDGNQLVEDGETLPGRIT